MSCALPHRICAFHRNPSSAWWCGTRVTPRYLLEPFRCDGIGGVFRGIEDKSSCTHRLPVNSSTGIAKGTDGPADDEDDEDDNADEDDAAVGGNADDEVDEDQDDDDCPKEEKEEAAVGGCSGPTALGR